MLRLRMSDLTETGILVRPHKTINTKRTARIFEWTPALRLAVEQAKAARSIDISPWLFCTREGEGYFNEDSGQASGWDSMWQRFMTRLLKDTDVKERSPSMIFAAKSAATWPALRGPPTCSVTQAKRLQSGTIDASQKSLNPSADLILHARNSNRRRSQVARISHDARLFAGAGMGDDVPRSAVVKRSKKVKTKSFCYSNGGNSDLWGRLLRFLRVTSKNLLFFSELVGRVGIEPTTN